MTTRDSDFLNNRAKDCIQKIKPYLRKGDRILDIGCGSAHIVKGLKELGYNITPLDVKNTSFFKDIKPIIYNGEKIPFKDNTFDVSLLITVLHHIKNPLVTLAEAKRVSKRIIIIEDLYEGLFQKYITFVMDSILNIEFFGHPHSNKTKVEWEELFKSMELKIIDWKVNKFWKFFTSGTFYLEKNSP